MIRHSHPWAYFLRKLHFKKTCAADVNFSTACKTQDMEGTIMSIDRKWTKMMLYSYTREFYSAIKKRK